MCHCQYSNVFNKVNVEFKTVTVIYDSPQKVLHYLSTVITNSIIDCLSVQTYWDIQKGSMKVDFTTKYFLNRWNGTLHFMKKYSVGTMKPYVVVAKYVRRTKKYLIIFKHTSPSSKIFEVFEMTNSSCKNSIWCKNKEKHDSHVLPPLILLMIISDHGIGTKCTTVVVKIG